MWMGGLGLHIFYSTAPLVGFKYREVLSEYHDATHGCHHSQIHLKPYQASLGIKFFWKLTLSSLSNTVLNLHAFISLHIHTHIFDNWFQPYKTTLHVIIYG